MCSPFSVTAKGGKLKYSCCGQEAVMNDGRDEYLRKEEEKEEEEVVVVKEGSDRRDVKSDKCGRGKREREWREEVERKRAW